MYCKANNLSPASKVCFHPTLLSTNSVAIDIAALMTRRKLLCAVSVRASQLPFRTAVLPALPALGSRPSADAQAKPGSVMFMAAALVTAIAESACLQYSTFSSTFARSRFRKSEVHDNTHHKSHVSILF